MKLYKFGIISKNMVQFRMHSGDSGRLLPESTTHIFQWRLILNNYRVLRMRNSNCHWNDALGLLAAWLSSTTHDLRLWHDETQKLDENAFHISF